MTPFLLLIITMTVTTSQVIKSNLGSNYRDTHSIFFPSVTIASESSQVLEQLLHDGLLLVICDSPVPASRGNLNNDANLIMYSTKLKKMIAQIA